MKIQRGFGTCPTSQKKYPWQLGLLWMCSGCKLSASLLLTQLRACLFSCTCLVLLRSHVVALGVWGGTCSLYQILTNGSARHPAPCWLWLDETEGPVWSSADEGNTESVKHPAFFTCSFHTSLPAMMAMFSDTSEAMFSCLSHSISGEHTLSFLFSVDKVLRIILKLSHDVLLHNQRRGCGGGGRDLGTSSAIPHPKIML